MGTVMSARHGGVAGAGALGFVLRAHDRDRDEPWGKPHKPHKPREMSMRRRCGVLLETPSHPAPGAGLVQPNACRPHTATGPAPE